MRSRCEVESGRGSNEKEVGEIIPQALPLSKEVWTKDNSKVAWGHEVVFDMVRM